MEENQKPEEQISYAAALAEIEAVLSRLNSNNADVDTLTEQVKRATELIKLCKQRLSKVEQQVNEIIQS